MMFNFILQNDRLKLKYFWEKMGTKHPSSRDDFGRNLRASLSHDK
jgi:hypothetical protein